MLRKQLIWKSKNKMNEGTFMEMEENPPKMIRYEHI